MYRTEDPPMIELGLRKSEGLSSNTSALEEFNDLKSEKSKN